MIRRVSMIILMQHDLEAAVTFYQLFDGLKLRFHLLNKWAEFTLEQTKLGLCPTSIQPTEMVHTGLVLETSNLLSFYEKYKCTISFVGEPIIKPHGIMIRIKDPGENLIDLYEPTPEQLKELVRQVNNRVNSDEDNISVSSQASCCRTQKGQDNPCC